MTRSARLVRAAIAAAAVCGVPAVMAQAPASPAGTTLSFVAVIKLNDSASLTGPGARSVGFQPGGRFVMVDGPAMVLLRSAYPEMDEIVDAPDWVTSERYDVQVQPDDPLKPEQQTQLLRAFLRDRFRLSVREDQRERPTFDLKLDREDGPSSPALQPYKADCAKFLGGGRSAPDAAGLPPTPQGAPPCGYTIGGGKVLSGGITMATFAQMLTGFAGRRVIDRTGLTGEYAFVLGLSKEVPIFTGLREQLGLRLEPSRAPLPVLVVDRIEKPTPN